MKASLGIVSAILLFTTGFAGAAEDGRLTFRLTNLHHSPVWVRLFSQDRLMSWPTEGRLFILADSAPRKFSVECQTGERICYGAWEEGNVDRDWGAGFEGKKDCDSCCKICEPVDKAPMHQVEFR